MVRTQIQLTDEQARKLRRRAKQEGISMSAMIRRCLDERLESVASDRSQAYRHASELVGQFPDHARAKDVAASHDRYLDETYR